jgi:hypothetical protein
MQNYNRYDLGTFGILAHGNPAVTPSQVAAAQVRSASEMASFVALVGDAVESERNETLSGSYLTELSRKSEQLKMGRVSNKTIADTFGYLRDFASKRGAPQTSSAVVQAAKWFWCNVEDPEACKAASSAVASSSPSAALPDYAQKPLLSAKQKQTALAVGVPVALTLVALYLIRRF